MVENDRPKNSTQILTLGCHQNGQHAINGRLNHFAIWYHRLADNQIEYFDGEFVYNGNDLCSDKATVCFRDTVPAPTDEENRNSSSALDQFQFDEDTTQAVDGDCTVESPLNWNGPHPIFCADTRSELEKAVNYNDHYDALDFANAMSRVCNRAGPNGLSVSDLNWTFNAFNIHGFGKLSKETPNRIENMPAKLLVPVQCASKLIESMYHQIWYREIIDRQKSSINQYMRLFENWLMRVLDWVEPLKGAVGSANHSTVVVMKMTLDRIVSQFEFPIYENTLDFGAMQRPSWRGCNDHVVVHRAAFMHGWALNMTEPLKLVGRIFNKYHEIMPAFLDQRITGLGSTKFTVNSRILSWNVYPYPDPNALEKYPVRFRVQHAIPNGELPFQKGAILCAYWIGTENSTQIGAWDIDKCKILWTNDTHTECACAQIANYAVLMEYREFMIPQFAYYICIGLGILSVFILLIFVSMIVAFPQVHNLLFVIYANMALAIAISLILYLVAAWLSGGDSNMGCIVISVLQHFTYSSGYTWQLLASLCMMRATCVRGGRPTGGIELVKTFTVLGWLVPGLVVIIMAEMNPGLYGYGNRCFASPYQSYNLAYFGTFLALLAMAFIFLLISAMCKNRYPHSKVANVNINYAIMGNGILVMLNIATWVMPVLIYVIGVTSEIPDFVFEILNSCQGIFMFILLGIMNPFFRDAIYKPMPEELKYDEIDEIDSLKGHGHYRGRMQ